MNNNEGRTKKDTIKPCVIFGWAEHMGIHQNPSLIGHPSINFHNYKGK